MHVGVVCGRHVERLSLQAYRSLLLLFVVGILNGLGCAATSRAFCAWLHEGIAKAEALPEIAWRHSRKVAGIVG